jgi:dTDP-4-dehydrorhamnose 3,5-epimerase-like enzyme
MKVTPLKINGFWTVDLNKFEDGRSFLDKSSRSEVIKKSFGLESRIKQLTTSLSRKKSIIFFRYTLSHPSPDFLNYWHTELSLSR